MNRRAVPVGRAFARYRDLARIPRAARFVSAGLLARAAHLMTILGVVFFVSASRGYGLAGAASATYALAYAVVGPALGRLADRRGQRPVLRAAAAASAAFRAAFLVSVWLEGPAWTIVSLSAISGAAMPPIGSFVRARWRALLAEPSRLSTAFSLESVIDELVYVVGPVIVANLATTVDPGAGLVVVLFCVVAGLGWLATERSTEPPVAPTIENRTEPGILASGRLIPLVLVLGTVGAALSSLEISIVAFCRHQHVPAASGWVLGLLALASALAGILYGARDWRAPPEHRLATCLPALAVTMSVFLLTRGLAGLLLASLALGLTVAPTTIAAFSAVANAVPPQRVTEGLTWISTSYGAGISLGSALTGRVVDAAGAHAGFATAAGCALLATLFGFAAMCTSRPTPARTQCDSG